MIRKYLPFIFILLTMILFGLLSLGSALHESLTYDEIVDLQEGRNAVLYHTFAIDPYNPPLTREIGIIPYLFTKDFYSNPLFAQTNPLPGRIMMILLGEGLLLAVFFTVYKYIGFLERAFASLLVALEPTILGNSHYVTMDIGLAVLFFLSYFLLISLFDKYSHFKLFFLAVLVGLGMATKITFIPFFLLSSIIITVAKGKMFGLITQLHIYKLALFVLTVFFILWSTYFFTMHVVIKERKDASRVSERLLSYAKNHHNQLLANIVMFGQNQPLPLGDYMATVKNNALRSLSRQECFFLGSIGQCKWYFMPVNFFLKLPFSLFILSIGGIVFLWKKKRETTILLAIPILSIIFVACTFRMQPLVRYILPLYPFLIILTAATFQFWQKNLGLKIIFAGCLMWYIITSLSSFPHFISYAQDFAGYPQERYTILEDSNLDWGQSLPDVAPYIKTHDIGILHLSYFGRDDGDLYGLKSDKPYGSYKENEICEFHTIRDKGSKAITLISVSNWYGCGYYKQDTFKNPKGVVSDSFLIF